MKIVDALGLVTAVAIGSAYLAWKTCVMRAQALATSVLRALSQDTEKIAGLRSRRLALCRRCPLYFRWLKTCGSPLKIKPLRMPNGMAAGCYCYLPVKTADPSSICWAAEMFDAGALPDHILIVTHPFMWREHDQGNL